MMKCKIQTDGSRYSVIGPNGFPLQQNMDRESAEQYARMVNQKYANLYAPKK